MKKIKPKKYSKDRKGWMNIVWDIVPIKELPPKKLSEFKKLWEESK